MFDHITFVEIGNNYDVRHKSEQRPHDSMAHDGRVKEHGSTKKILTGDEFAAASGLNTEELGEYVSPVKHTKYHIGGTMRLLLPRAVSSAARESFLYLQSFSWMQADHTYFTDRETADTYLLLMTYAGKGELEYNGEKYSLKKGDGFLIDCRTPQKYHTSGTGWEISGLHFNGTGADELFRQFSQDGKVNFHETPDGYIQMKLEQLLRDYQLPSLSRDLRVHRNLTDILVYLISEKEKIQTEKSMLGGQLQYLIQYMQSHLSDPVNMDFLAHFTGISKYHLSREFKRLTGCAPIEYLIRLRTEKAKLLLVQTDYPLRIIAEQTGMGNEQYFSRVFHERTGMTPGQYRKKFQL